MHAMRSPNLNIFAQGKVDDYENMNMDVECVCVRACIFINLHSMNVNFRVSEGLGGVIKFTNGRAFGGMSLNCCKELWGRGATDILSAMHVKVVLKFLNWATE